jgi:kynurenine formamidase
MLRVVHDLIYPIEPGMFLYPGDASPEVFTVSDGGLRTSELRVGCHVGTHVDAPLHFLPEGAAVEDLPMEHFFGPAVAGGRGRRGISCD